MFFIRLEELHLLNKKRLCCLSIVLFFLIIFLIWLNVRYLPGNLTITILNSNYSNHIVNYQQQYLYSTNDGIYSCFDNQKHSELSGDKLLCADGNSLYAYVKQTGKVFEFVGESWCEIGTLDKKLRAFSIIDGLIIYVASDESYSVLSFNDFLEYPLPEKNRIENLGVDFYSVDGSVMLVRKLREFTFSFFSSYQNTNNPIFCYRSSFAGFTPYVSEGIAIISEDMYVGSQILYQYSLSDYELIKQTNLESSLINQILYSDGDNIVFFGLKVPSDPHLSFEEMKNIKYHSGDCIQIIDAETLDISKEYSTRKYERIIYADSKKAITYYKGEYLTYSLDNWEITNKQKAEEINSSGRYTFEICGEYVFVFDNSTGELINTIPV